MCAYDIVLFSKTSHRLPLTKRAETAEIPQNSLFRQRVYFFFLPQKPSDRLVIIIIVVVVSSMTAVVVSSDDVDKSRGRNVKQHDEEDPDTYINMYKRVRLQNNIIGLPPSRQTKSPGHLRGTFRPGPKTPNNGFYTCKPRDKFHFRPPFVYILHYIILLYCTEL